MSELLRLTGLRAGYGESVVLHDISMSVAEGEIVCLLGANGAGKTTTTRVLTGLLPNWAGEIWFDGVRIDSMPSHLRVEQGICLAPEGRQVFPQLTGRENLLLGSYSKRSRPARKQTLDEVFDLFPALVELSGRKAGVMSGGQQQMLAIGRALMGKPRLLVLDEPSLGLSPKMVLHVYEAILRTAGNGLSILFVEQNVRAALSVAHRGYVLNNGRIALGGSAAELNGSQLVQEAFLARVKRRGEATQVHANETVDAAD